MNKGGLEDVSDTAFWVAYFRAKEKENENSKPLFHDPFAKTLIGSRGEAFADATPNIRRYAERAVLSRTVIIDRFIEPVIKEGVDAIINLGAGLDARPYRMNLPEDLLWIEVDYPNTIDYKNAVLKSEKPKCKLTRVALDLGDTEKRRHFFSSVVPQTNKCLILTEGVIVYLTANEVTALAQDILEQKRFVYWIMDYLHKRVHTFVRGAKGEMRNTPFKFFPEEWYSFFENIGWVQKEIVYAGKIAAEFKRELPIPKLAKLILLFSTKKLKPEFRRSSGFAIFRRRELCA